MIRLEVCSPGNVIIIENNSFDNFSDFILTMLNNKIVEVEKLDLNKGILFGKIVDIEVIIKELRKECDKNV